MYKKHIGILHNMVCKQEQNTYCIFKKKYIKFLIITIDI